MTGLNSYRDSLRGPHRSATDLVRFDRLPVWARQELNRLADSLANRERLLAAGPDDSDTFAGPFHVSRDAEEGRGRPLGTRPEIRHVRADGHLIHVRFLEDGDVEITMDGGVSLVAMGGAANVVRARLESWDAVERRATRAEMGPRA